MVLVNTRNLNFHLVSQRWGAKPNLGRALSLPPGAVTDQESRKKWNKSDCDGVSTSWRSCLVKNHLSSPRVETKKSDIKKKKRNKKKRSKIIYRRELFEPHLIYYNMRSEICNPSDDRSRGIVREKKILTPAVWNILFALKGYLFIYFFLTQTFDTNKWTNRRGEK